MEVFGADARIIAVAQSHDGLNVKQALVIDSLSKDEDIGGRQTESSISVRLTMARLLQSSDKLYHFC
jgi:hypothetical protein